VDGSGTPVDVYARGPDVGDGAGTEGSRGQRLTDAHDHARCAGCVDGDGSTVERGSVIGRRPPDGDVLMNGSTGDRHRRRSRDGDIEPVGINAGGIDARRSRYSTAHRAGEWSGEIRSAERGRDWCSARRLV